MELFGGGAAAGALYIAAKFFDMGTYRLGRLVAVMDPWADQTGSGWQVIQGLYAIGSRSDFLAQGLEIVLRNIFIYLSHKMISFFLLLQRNLDLLGVQWLYYYL